MMTEHSADYCSYIKSQVNFLKDNLERARRVDRPFVTISREAGAYGMTIAKRLCEYLQLNDQRKKSTWTVFDKELLKIVVEEHNLPEKVLPYLSETTITEIQDMLEEICGLHPSRNLLFIETSETILHLAQLGYAILVGRGSNIITAKVPGGVHVRLVSSIENRVNHMQTYLKISKKDAIKFVVNKDRNRSNYIKKYFEKNISDPMLYDLVLNVDKFGPEKCVSIIGNLVLKRWTLK